MYNKYKYGNIRKKYNNGDVIMFIHNKSNFNYGMIAFINKFSPSTQDFCYIKI